MNGAFGITLNGVGGCQVYFTWDDKDASGDINIAMCNIPDSVLDDYEIL